MNRRSFLFGVGASLIAAPAIVRAASLMPVRGIVMAVDNWPVFKIETFGANEPYLVGWDALLDRFKIIPIPGHEFYRHLVEEERAP